MSYLAEHDEHPSWVSSVCYLEIPMQGRLMIEICISCGYLLVHCEHERCSWDSTGSTLTCDMCGVDGT